MTRHVFFSFHYDRDIRRVSQIRNSWVVRHKGEAQPFYDTAEWERTKRRGVKKWIEKQLTGTSVTVVLIGAETYERKWVHYEIKRSHELGKGIIGIYIHNVKDPVNGKDKKGRNPLDDLVTTPDGREVPFSSIYKTYDWVSHDGYSNFSTWIEEAAAAAGR